MAVRYAIEGETLDFGAAATWGGGAPASGDTLVMWGRHRFTSGLNQAAVNLAAMIATKGASVEFDGLLQIAVNNSGQGLVWQASSGTLRLSGNTNILSLAAPAVVPSIEGGAHAQVVASLGRSVINDSATVTAVSVGPRAVVELAAHVSDRVDTARVAGVLDTKRSVEAGTVSGRGRLVFRKAGTVSDGAAGGLVEVFDEEAAVIFLNDQSVTADEIKLWAGSRVCRDMAGILTVTDETYTAMAFRDATTAQGAVVNTNTPTSYGGGYSALAPGFAPPIGI